MRSSRGSSIAPFALAALMAACGPDARVATAPTDGAAARATAPADRETAAARWDVLTRLIVGRREAGPLGLSRTFALVSVARYDAVIAAEDAKVRGQHPSVAGAAARAAADVLAGLYPVEGPVVQAQLAADRAYFPGLPSERDADFAAGEDVGRRVAAAVLARAATDRSNAVWTGTIPTGPGFWRNAPPPAQPLAPLWGQVRPWVMASGDQFRPAAPPAFGSPEFLSSLAEVRHYADTRTPEQLAIAQFWGITILNAGAPPGYFGALGLEMAARHHLDERQTSRMLALVHMATMDASIGCWDAKFAYWYIRPFQADPGITTPVGRPNFPSYPSAHSCLSAAGAGVLMGLFPEETNDLQAQVEEAGWARIYGGLHFDFDVTAGQDLGYSVARLVLDHAPRGHEAIPLD